MEHGYNLKAIIWDYDNTLVDTRLKNYNVTRNLIADVTGRAPEDFPFLANVDSYIKANHAYTNWRDLYRNELGLGEDQTDMIGRLWSDYQRRDHTPVEIFAGITDVLETLQDLPHGIVSQNARESVMASLEKFGILGFFQSILGYEEVDIRRQKPDPDGLLSCINDLIGEVPGTVVYIGDHATDILCAANANRYYRKNGRGIRVVSIHAQYGVGAHLTTPDLQANFTANETRQLAVIIRKMMS